MIKAIDSGTEYAADDNINRAATVIENSRICQWGCKTVAFIENYNKKLYFTNSSDNMGFTTVVFYYYYHPRTVIQVLHLCLVPCIKFTPQKGCNREYLQNGFKNLLKKMKLLFINFALEFQAPALRKSGSFTVISLFLIQTHFNLFGSSPMNSPPVAGELGQRIRHFLSTGLVSTYFAMLIL